MKYTSLLAFAIATACGSGAPTRPSATAGSTPNGDSPFVMSVLDGVTREPVAGAHVSSKGEAPEVTDDLGRVTVPAKRRWQAVGIDADGYLPRRTPLDTTVTLWPAASDAEREAIHAMAFDAGTGQMLAHGDQGASVTLAVRASVAPETVYQVWRSQMDEISREFDVEFQFHSTYQYDPNEIAVVVSDEPCGTPTAFCGYAPRFQLDPAEALDPVVVRRLLLRTLLNPNPLDGFTNAERPQAELSALERQTLTMLGQRKWGSTWPDTDPGF